MDEKGRGHQGGGGGAAAGGAERSRGIVFFSLFNFQTKETNKQNKIKEKEKRGVGLTRKTNPHRPGLGLGRRGRVFVRGRVSVCGCGLLMHQNVSASVSSGCLRFPPSFFFLFCSLLRWADSVEMQQQQKNKSINITKFTVYQKYQNYRLEGSCWHETC